MENSADLEEEDQIFTSSPAAAHEGGALSNGIGAFGKETRGGSRIPSTREGPAADSGL